MVQIVLIRHRGSVVVFEGLIVSSHRKPVHLPNLTGFKEEQALMLWGDMAIAGAMAKAV